MSLFGKIPGFRRKEKESRQPSESEQTRPLDVVGEPGETGVSGEQPVEQHSVEQVPSEEHAADRAFPPLEQKKPGLFGPRVTRSDRRAARASRPSSGRRGIIGRTIDGFTNPVTRPRFIIMASIGAVLLASLVVVALGVTSTRWFCSEGCHKVQDDTIIAYQRSSHSQVSCMACHMPAGADPVTFLIHKAEALGELYLTVTNDFELPLNGESHVALTMPAAQCTQCHNLELRRITPASGVIIDHEAHKKAGVECTICHNRVAHREDFDLTLKHPDSQEPNRKHEDFMSMTACFRCHTQGDVALEGGLKAPGECSACHPSDFDLKPAYHKEDGFFPKGHAKLGQEAASKAASASAEAEEVALEPASEDGGHGEGGIGEGLPKVSLINECSTCHSEKFCSDCHGLPMPHPADFRKGHGELGKKNPKTCSTCHGAADRFCDDCHHGTSLEYAIDKQRPWIKQHFEPVRNLGASACFECHNPTFCARCHVRGGGS